MNFETFSTVAELNKRIDKLKEDGAVEIIPSFNGSVYTLKWR